MNQIILDDEEESAGSSWLATFADLMSLLMCFFVLLLSFSEMDVLKYKQVAGSMRDAFGVQNKVKVKDIPKGTSVIAQEFSAGRPDPTPLNRIEQVTADITRQTLDTRSRPPGKSEIKSLRTPDSQEAEAMVRQVLQEQSDATALILSDALQDEIDAGMVDIESGLVTVTIRIREKGAFPSGSADLNEAFVLVMARLRLVLKGVEGAIAVEGHTDDVPISNSMFRSNWDLSVDRALSVAHELMKDREVEQERFMIIGYADTRPQAANDSAENRGRNRRVEIVIRRGFENGPSTELPALDDSAPGFIPELAISDANGFTAVSQDHGERYLKKNEQLAVQSAALLPH